MELNAAVRIFTLSCFLMSFLFFKMGKGELGGLSHRATAAIFLALGIIGLVLLF